MGDVSRRMQDQQGDLATQVEEAATGIRVIKAFGRGPLLQRRFGAAARTLQSTSLDGVRTILEEIALTNPAALSEDPARFVDDRFIRELDASGFISSLYP